jgi:hypothetical protein
MIRVSRLRSLAVMGAARGSIMMDLEPFRVCPDYHQFYLEDGGGPYDVPEDIRDEDLDRRVLVASSVIAVFTFDNNTVHGEVVLEEKEPELELDGWDHVVECGLNVTSGKLALRTPTCGPMLLKVTPVLNGVYKVRLHIRGLDQWTGEGEDRDSLEFYRFVLWLPDNDLRVLKQWRGARRA